MQNPAPEGFAIRQVWVVLENSPSYSENSVRPSGRSASLHFLGVEGVPHFKLTFFPYSSSVIFLPTFWPTLLSLKVFYCNTL